MQKTQVQFPGQGDPLEKDMITDSSILAWEILWIEDILAGYSEWGRRESNTAWWLNDDSTCTLQNLKRL